MVVKAHILGSGSITTNGEVYQINFIVEDRNHRVFESPVLFYREEDVLAVQRYYRTSQSFYEPLEFEI